MSVVLRPVNRENFFDALALELGDDQRDFVAANLFSLAEAYVDATLTPRAIYASGIMVGFVMYGLDPLDGRAWIVRLMIDYRHQGQGYGRAALQQAIAALHTELGCTEVAISYTPANTIAAQLYAALGFVPTGEMIDDEVVAYMSCEEGWNKIPA